MKHMTMGKKLMSLVLALTMIASLLTVSASATAGSVEEAKAILADVALTQTYNGTTTADIPNGERGPKGDTGDSYVLTSADKSEIAQLVLAELPTAESEAF